MTKEVQLALGMVCAVINVILLVLALVTGNEAGAYLAVLCFGINIYVAIKNYSIE
jgi:hypothetical protein